jgi:hypothetical protein
MYPYRQRSMPATKWFWLHLRATNRYGPSVTRSCSLRGSEVALRKALDFINTYPAMQNPRSFRSVIEEGLDEYVGFYAPGDTHR